MDLTILSYVQPHHRAQDAMNLPTGHMSTQGLQQDFGRLDEGSVIIGENGGRLSSFGTEVPEW